MKSKMDGPIKPFVSIIIPAYNEAFMLEESLSALNRIKYDKKLFEIILVDNGSTDNTVEVANKFNARVVNYPSGKTIGSVRNKGASFAKGEVLAFLDADCVVTEDWLLNAVKWLENGSAAVGSRAFSDYKTANWLQKCWITVVPKSLSKAVKVDWLSSSNIIIKKHVFDEVNGFNEKLETCEDVDLGFRISKMAEMIYDPNVKAYHLRDPIRLSEIVRKEIWHGKSIFVGAKIHGYGLREAMSIGVPAFFLLSLILLVACICTDCNYWPTLLICLFMVPLIMTVRNISRVKSSVMLMQCFLMNSAYITGRALAILVALTQIPFILKREKNDKK